MQRPLAPFGSPAKHANIAGEAKQGLGISPRRAAKGHVAALLHHSQDKGWTMTTRSFGSAIRSRNNRKLALRLAVLVGRHRTRCRPCVRRNSRTIRRPTNHPPPAEATTRLLACAVPTLPECEEAVVRSPQEGDHRPRREVGAPQPEPP